MRVCVRLYCTYIVTSHMSLSCSPTWLHQVPPLMCFHMFWTVPQSSELYVQSSLKVLQLYLECSLRIERFLNGAITAMAFIQECYYSVLTCCLLAVNADIKVDGSHVAFYEVHCQVAVMHQIWHELYLLSYKLLQTTIKVVFSQSEAFEASLFRCMDFFLK